MSLLQQLIDGSLVSRDRLMRAREFYSPAESDASAGVAFARWTKRVSQQSALVVAREMAGLSDAELSALEAEFASRPMRQSLPWVRHAVVVGTVLVVMAGLGLGVQAWTSLGQAAQALQVASVT